MTAVVLAKDRPAQLDLLLRSLEVNTPGLFDPIVVSDPAGPRFEKVVRLALALANDLVCFMCDDAILYRPPPMRPIPVDDELCFSLRLGTNTVMQYPTGLAQRVPFTVSHSALTYAWRWQDADGDFGYPGSIDGHVFRRTELLEILDGRSFPNPTALECALVDGCETLRERRPMMACYPASVYVGNPVNRVSEQSNVRHGERFPADPAELTRRFQNGERLSLERMDFSGVDGAHAELELVWEEAAVAVPVSPSA